MNGAETWINHLEANAREELASQQRLLELLEKQERAVVGGRSPEVLEASRALDAETEKAGARAVTRKRVLEKIAAAWGLPASAMTLGSIAERLGDRGGRLAELRTRLRTVAAQVVRKNRRVAAVARLHRQVVRDVLDTLLHDDAFDGSACETSGTLIDAEA